MTWIGIIPILGAAASAGELAYEQTVLTWTSGLQMVGFSLFHGGFGILGLLCAFLACAWAVIFLVVAVVRRSIGTRLNLVLVGVLALSLGVQSVSYGSWILAMAVLSGGQARTEWLIFAAGNDDVRLANYMLAHGIDVNAQDSRGRSALGAAATEGKTEVARLLLAKGARTDSRTSLLGETPLTQAAQMNHFDMVKLLVESGADLNVRDADDNCRCNALDWAIKQGNQEMADFLRSRMHQQ
jgi:hypothetical protein